MPRTPVATSKNIVYSKQPSADTKALQGQVIRRLDKLHLTVDYNFSPMGQHEIIGDTGGYTSNDRIAASDTKRVTFKAPPHLHAVTQGKRELKKCGLCLRTDCVAAHPFKKGQCELYRNFCIKEVPSLMAKHGLTYDSIDCPDNCKN